MKRILTFIIVLWAATPAFAGSVQGLEFIVDQSPFSNDGVLYGDEMDIYTFSLEKGDRASWTVTICNLTRLDVMLVPAHLLVLARYAPNVSYYRESSDLHSIGCSLKTDRTGSLAILVTPSKNTTVNARYTISISIQRHPPPTPWDLIFSVLGGLLVLGLTGGAIHAFHLVHIVKGLWKRPVKATFPVLRQARSPLPGAFAAGMFPCPYCGIQVMFDPDTGRYFCPKEGLWL